MNEKPLALSTPNTTTPGSGARHRRPTRSIRARVAAAAAAAALLGGGLSIGLIASPAPTASAETPAERCARETNAYNQAWATSWAAANGQPASQAPPPPVPYVCNNPTPPTRDLEPDYDNRSASDRNTGKPRQRPQRQRPRRHRHPPPRRDQHRRRPRPRTARPANRQLSYASAPGPYPSTRHHPNPRHRWRPRPKPEHPHQHHQPTGTPSADDDEEVFTPTSSGSQSDTEVGEATTIQAFGPSTGGEPQLPLAFWLLTGAAAMTAASPRARRAVRGWSLLERGGDSRAEIGPTRLVLIHDETSDHQYVFDMNVPEGGWTEVNPDGSATVYDANGNPVSQVLPPWAFDAAGRPQNTWYTVDEDGNLVQHVQPADNALYPILADPTEVGAVDTTGRSDGDTWTEDLGNGEIATHTIVEGTGGETVDTTVTREDGTHSDIRSVSDGEGGYTIWADNSDGSSAWANRQGTDGNTNTEHYDPNQTPIVSSQGDASNSNGTITTNNPDGTQSNGNFERTGDNRFGTEVTNPDGTTTSIDSTLDPNRSPNTMVTDSDGSRVADSDGNIVAVDAHGNQGAGPRPNTGSFYNPETGTWHNGAVNPDNGAKTFRLDDGSLLTEHPQLEGRPSWTLETTDGNTYGLGEDIRIDPITGQPSAIVVDPDTGELVADPLAESNGNEAAQLITSALISTALSANGQILESAGTPSGTPRSLSPRNWPVPNNGTASAIRWGGRALGPAGGILGAELDRANGTSAGQAYTQNGVATAAGIGATAATIWGASLATPAAPAVLVGTVAVGAGALVSVGTYMGVRALGRTFFGWS